MSLYAKAPNGLLVSRYPASIPDAPGGVGWTDDIRDAQSWKSAEEALSWCQTRSANLAKWVRTGIADPGPAYNKDAVRLVSL